MISLLITKQNMVLQQKWCAECRPHVQEIEKAAPSEEAATGLACIFPDGNQRLVLQFKQEKKTFFQIPFRHYVKTSILSVILKILHFSPTHKPQPLYGRIYY